MALSDDKLWDLWNAQGTDDMSGAEAFVFARAVEAAVRKDDEALIRQMLDALEKSQQYTEACADGKRVQWWGSQLDRADAAITAAKVRLGGQHGTDA